MFKKTVLAAIAILAAFALAGCGGKTTQNAAPTTTNAQEQQSVQTSNGIPLPSDKPAYIAKVVSVSNDQVAIYKADSTSQQQGKPQGTNNQGAPPQGPPQGANQDAQQGADGNAPAPGGQMKFSEQADTITVPASAQVVTGSPQGGNMSSVKVSDIKQDQIIQVWEKDGAITFVQVMEDARNMPNAGPQQQKNGQ